MPLSLCWVYVSKARLRIVCTRRQRGSAQLSLVLGVPRIE